MVWKPGDKSGSTVRQDFVSSRTRTGPDPQIVRDQLLQLQNIYKVYGSQLFSSQMLWILRKNPEPGSKIINIGSHWNQRLVPFKLNRIQRDIENRKGKRNIYLKARQGGYTTHMINHRLYVPAVLEPGTGGLLISQNSSYVAKHFDILKRTHKWFGCRNPFNTDDPKNDPWKDLQANLLHTTYSSRRELIFDQIDSRVLCDSAEVEEAGQGLTIQHCAATEVARWAGKPEETLANIKEAIPSGGTLDIESTANGMGGYFFQEIMRSRDPANKYAEFTYFFHEWWHIEEYRDDDRTDPKTLTEEEEQLIRNFNLDLEQITWRRKKVIELRHNFPEKYPEDDITAFLVVGKQYFDKEVLRLRYLELQSFKPLAKYRGGDLVIRQRRVKGRNYIIGADPATGREISADTDFSAAVVIDLETGEEVAWYCCRIPPEEFAFDLADLARQYNDALVVVERTGDGGTVILTLEVQCQFFNIYQHRDWWKKDKEKQIQEFPGFPTTPKTRPIALNKLAQFVRDEPELFWDVQFIQEATTFVRNEKGIPAAAEECHDDRVMCRALAHAARLVRLGYLDFAYAPREKYGTNQDELK